MHITIEHHDKSFNVNISSAEGREAFLSIKGCRIASGSKGEFVSYPANKSESTGKWWNHVWASDKFNAVVLSKYHESQKQSRKMDAVKARELPKHGGGFDDMDSDIPF